MQPEFHNACLKNLHTTTELKRVFSTSVAEDVGEGGCWGGLARAYVMGLFLALTHSIWNELDAKCKSPKGRRESEPKFL